jgi:hypothetical protein
VAYIEEVGDNPTTNQSTETMTTKLYRLTVGLESPAELSSQECAELFERLCAQSFPEGHSLIRHEGRWLSPDRGIVVEQSITLEVVGPAELVSEVMFVGHQYKKQAQQDSVLFAQLDADYQFL